MGQPPHAGRVKVGPRIQAPEQDKGLMTGTCLCLHLTPTVMMPQKWKEIGAFSLFITLGEKDKPDPANLPDILERIIKMKLSSSLSRTELDSPCYGLRCYQLKREKKLGWKFSTFHLLLFNPCR